MGKQASCCVLRRAITGEKVIEGQCEAQKALFNGNDGIEIAGYEYSVLVSNTDYEIFSLGQLYRDRADCENAFDELKNQWGWCGFTTRDIHRCRLSAAAVALIYNWWSLFVRLANPEARCEAITSRPWLMASIGCKTQKDGQTCITLTGLHARFEEARVRLTRVSTMLQRWFAEITEQLKKQALWKRVCDYLKLLLAGMGAKKKPRLVENPPELVAANCGF